MARRKGKTIFGSIDRVVYKVIRGQQIMSSKPGKGTMKQTAPTKARASLFGKGSALAKSIRLGLKELLTTNHDGTYVFRFTAAINAVLRQCYDTEAKIFNLKPDSFDSLNGFEFNADSPVKKTMWLSPTSIFSENKLIITLPELKIPQELKFPGKATHCRIIFHAHLLNLEEGLRYPMPVRQIIEIEKTQALLEKQHLEFIVPEGCFVLVGFVLEFYSIRNNLAILFNNKTFNPGAICAAYDNPGEFKPEKISSWADKEGAKLE